MPLSHLTPADQLVLSFDNALRTLFGKPRGSGRASPAAGLEEADLSETQRRHAARLMRINHSGEVCAQALYQGQAATARHSRVRQDMAQAAREENDHLAWCERRLQELDERKSLLNPLWFAGSFALGAAAGLAGDKWSLGFVAETEKQVSAHLDDHLRQLPPQDRKDRAIIQQMREDEMQHASHALEAGGAKLPLPIRLGMKAASRLMTRTSYHV
jgi:ubiquinone biosynthesis monooxygenase Coq7